MEIQWRWNGDEIYVIIIELLSLDMDLRAYLCLISIYFIMIIYTKWRSNIFLGI
jgi:hypothetical protein